MVCKTSHCSRRRIYRLYNSSDGFSGYTHTTRVPEHGREYSISKQQRGEQLWNSDEFLLIANEQTRCENEAARFCSRILICDTNAFATRLWHRRYMESFSPELDEFAKSSRANLYILTGDEIPFVQDGLRDGEHIRHEMHRWFVNHLEKQRGLLERVY